MASNPGGICWAGFTRDAKLLSECGSKDPDVAALAKKLMGMKPTPGWEFAKGSGKLRAVKFHLHSKLTSCSVVWASCCVYDSGLINEKLAKNFVEKLLFLTEPLREETPPPPGQPSPWASLAPMMQQRMEQSNAGGKLAMVQGQVDGIKEIMSNNINLMLEREQQLSELNDKATALGNASQLFQKGATKARKFQMWQQAKFGAAAGTAVTVGVGVVTIPPAVALMGPAGWAVGGVAAAGAGIATGVKMGRGK